MKFDNHFEVPLPPAAAWDLLLDVRRVAPCLPGAELTEVIDDRSFKGRVSVKLGPVALTFAGTARFEAIDAANHRATVKAQGTDAKGRGGANATTVFALTPVATGTRVDIATDLSLSGGVAQYGRGAGMIQEVASQIIGQFARNLGAEIARTTPEPMAAAVVPIGGVGLVLRAFWSWLRQKFGGSA